jgi:hypothetical protein
MAIDWNNGPPVSLADGDILVALPSGVTYSTDDDLVNPTLLQVKEYVLDGLGIADVSGLQTELDGKADTTHTHAISDVTGLQAALDLKAASSHTHTTADITDFATEMATKADATHSHAISDVTGLQTALDGKASSSHTHTSADITDAEATGISLLQAATAAAARTVLALGDLALLSWDADAAIDFQSTDLVMVARGGAANQPHTVTGEQIADFVITQLAIASVSGLQAALDAKADTSHTHAIADTTGLQAALDAKAATSHTHAIADTTGLQTALDGKASSTHSHAIADVTDLQTELDGKSDTSHTHVIADVTDLQTALDGKAASSHTHAIADTTGLQAALDAKSATGHSHVIADITSLQTSLDAKAAATHTHEVADLSDASATALAMLVAADAAAIRTVLGLGSAALSDAGDFASSISIEITDVINLETTLADKLDDVDPTFTGQAFGPDGSAAAPTYSFTGDVNTGLFNPAAGEVGIALDGSEQVRINFRGMAVGHGSVIKFFQVDGPATDVAFDYPRIQAHGTSLSGPHVAAACWATDTARYSHLTMARSKHGTIGSHTAMGSGEYLGTVDFLGSDGSKFLEGASIRAKTTAAYTTDTATTQLEFYTSNGGASTARALLDQYGSLVVGNTTSPARTAVIRAAGNAGVAVSATLPKAFHANVAFQSGTDIGYGFHGELSVAASVALNGLAQFAATTPTLGSGASITNKYGFFVAGGIAIGTNNYGFYTNIGAAASRWNFYAAGTAANYFAGTIASLGSYTATTASAANMNIASDGSIARSTSSARYKKDIENADPVIADKLMAMRPVWYRSTSKVDRQDWSHYGLIAEEVAALEPRFVHWGRPSKKVTIESGGEMIDTMVEDTDAPLQPEGVAYDRLVVAVIVKLKQYEERIASLEGKLAAAAARK